MAGLYLAAIMGVSDGKRMALFVISLFPTIDIVSDINYLVVTRYFDMALFSISAAVLLLPNVLFIWIVATVRGQNTGKRAFPTMLKKSFPGLRFHRKIFWLSSEGGFPLNPITDVAVQIFDNHDSIPKLMVLGCTWLFFLASQIGYLMVFGVWLIIAGCFLVGWLLLGIWVFQNKTLSTKLVWNLWFRVWTGTTEFDKMVEVDVAILNGSVFAEFMCETLPQIVLQFTNNQLTNLWDSLGYFSIFFSLVMAANGSYRYLYWVIGRGRDMHEVPAEVSLMGFGSVKLDYEAESLRTGGLGVPNAAKLKRMGDKLWIRLVLFQREIKVMRLLDRMHVESVAQLPSIIDKENEQVLEELVQVIADDTELCEMLQRYVKKSRLWKQFDALAEVDMSQSGDMEMKGVGDQTGIEGASISDLMNPIQARSNAEQINEV